MLSLFGSYECIIARIFLAVKNMANIFLSQIAQNMLLYLVEIVFVESWGSIMATIYFENGQVVRIDPEPEASYYEVREIINESEDIVSDGARYDLRDPDSIKSIKVPHYVHFHKNEHAKDLGVTGYIDYVLRMHAGLLWNNAKYYLAMACLGKACQLMLYSTVGWARSDYIRVVNWNIELGHFKKAQEWWEWILKNTVDPDDYGKIKFNDVVDDCKYLGTNLVEVDDVGICCGTCSKYQNRIFSLPGKISRFPKFPSDFCFNCGLNISPFILGVSEPVFACKNIVKYSKRPFVDTRTEQQKEAYILHKETIEKKKARIQSPDLNHIIYYWFKPIFPRDFPKSVGAFSRMRNANTASYQRLVKLVESSGYRIPTSLDEVAKWDEANT